VNCVRSERDLERLHMIQSVATLFILLLAVYELNHPGASIVPGWIEFGASNMGEDFNRRNVRIGSIFMDYELLADFCALNLLFFFFQLSRGGSTLRRSFFGGMIGLSLLVMFSTVTRGPIFSLAIAVAFLLWLTRRHLRIVPMMIGAAVISAAFVGMNFFVANFTRSGDLFGRLGQTTFVGGVPDSRSGIWQEAIQRWAMHPLIGWGPYYAHEHGLVQWYWPHNLYLYVANIIGVVGLAFYLWLLFKLWRVTSPRVDTLSSPSYVESYLLIAHVQLAFFLIDQFKIEYLRNNVYQYQVWLMFALWVAASRLVKDGSAPAAAPSPVAAR
jgi:O-antigen ligase